MNGSSNDREKAMRRIRACLRLSQSSNPHEAAAALRQAQKLMSEFGIDASAAESNVGSDDAATRQRGATPPQSVVALAALIARGFSCRAVVVMGAKTAIRFFGVDGTAEVAVYAFTVLRRQLDKAKARHVRRCRKRVVKEQRAEAFAIGWVDAVRALFPSEDLPANLEAAFDAATRGQTTGETTGREIGRKRVAENDHWAGYVAGKSARYSPGVKGHARRAIGQD